MAGSCEYRPTCAGIRCTGRGLADFSRIPLHRLCQLRTAVACHSQQDGQRDSLYALMYRHCAQSTYPDMGEKKLVVTCRDKVNQ